MSSPRSIIFRITSTRARARARFNKCLYPRTQPNSTIHHISTVFAFPSFRFHLSSFPPFVLLIALSSRSLRSFCFAASPSPSLNLLRPDPSRLSLGESRETRRIKNLDRVSRTRLFPEKRTDKRRAERRFDSDRKSI